MTEQFHYTTEAGVEIVLPYVGKIKSGVMRKIRKADPVDQVFTLLEAVADEETLAKVDDLDIVEVNTLFEQWQEATGSVGESSRSSS